MPFYRFFLSGSAGADNGLLYKDSEMPTAAQRSRAHRSFAYKIAERVTLASGLKKRWNYSAPELARYLRKTNQSRKLIPPSDLYDQFDIETIMIDDRPCYFVSPKNQKIAPDKAILFFHGGGFIYEMHQIHWEFVRRLVHKTSLPVCIPMYPVFPSIDSERSMRFIIACYREFLSRYPARKIIAIGDSAGSDLNLSFWHYLTLHSDDYEELPFPERLILISPVMVVGNDEAILAEMKKIEAHDSMLAMNMLETLPLLFEFPENELNWFTAPLYGDFSKFPPMFVFSGTFDIFYPQIKFFVERVRAQGKYIEFYTGYEMMHDWPIVPAIPECETALNEIIRLIME
jgi:acetyl esterase/lipase